MKHSIIQISTRIKLILILSALSWMLFEFYKLVSSEINFFELKQVPISLAFFVSTLLFALNTTIKFNFISFLLFISSTLVLSIALFSEISFVVFFKLESVVLLMYGAFVFYSISNRKSILHALIYFGTAILFSLSLILELSSSLIQVSQLILGVLTSALVLVASIKKAN